MIYVKECLPMFSSKSFIVSGFTFRFLIHFELVHIYGIYTNGTDEPIYKGRNRDADIENRLWTQQGKEIVGQTGRVALTYIHHHM